MVYLFSEKGEGWGVDGIICFLQTFVQYTCYVCVCESVYVIVGFMDICSI